MGQKRAFTAGVEKLSAMVGKEGGNFNIVLHYGALSKSAKTSMVFRSTRSRRRCSATSIIRKRTRR